MRISPHSIASFTAMRRFGTPSLAFMRWNRESIELLLTRRSAAIFLLLCPCAYR